MAGRYPLADLLSARKFREENAEREASRAASALEQAEREARETRERYEEYRRWRPGEEKRLFEKLRRRQVPLSELEGHKEDVHRLRAAELLREEEAEKAEERARAALAGLERARAALLSAVRDRRKIEEHREAWLREEAVRRDLAEESELEDFHSPGAVDDGGGVEATGGDG